MTESNSESVSLKFLWSLLLEGPDDREPWTSVATPDWSPDGSYLIVSGYQVDDDTVMGPGDSWDIIWRVSTDGNVQWRIRNRDWVAFSPDGKQLVMTNPTSINDPATGKQLKEIDPNDPEFISCLNRDDVYKVSETECGIELHRPDGHKELIYNGSDKIITALLSQDKTNITLICLKTVVCVELPGGKERWRIGYNSLYKPHLTDNIELIVLLKDIGQDIHLIERETGNICQTISGHEKRVTAAGFFQDGMKLITGSCDHTIRVWDIESGKEQAMFVLDNENEARGFSFSPDGTKLAVICWRSEGRYNYSLKLFDLIQPA